MEENKNLKVKIIFTASNEEDHPAIKPVRHLLSIAEKANEVKTQKALDDWYLAGTKDYETLCCKIPYEWRVTKTRR